MQEETEVIYLDGEAFEIGDILPYLTREDIERAERYVLLRDKNAHLISAYFKRKYIGEWEETASGKPVSKNAFFNVSHCENIVVFVSDAGPIGIDVEKIRPIEDEVKRYVFSDEEYAYIKTHEDFYSLWTAKESLAKAAGTGIGTMPKTVPALPVRGEKIYERKIYYSEQIKMKNAIISVTREGKEPFELKIKKGEL